MDHQLGTRAGALRLVFGVTATVAGLDKIFNLLADWSTYVSPLAASLLPVSPETFMNVVGTSSAPWGLRSSASHRCSARTWRARGSSLSR